jgi:cystathionine beta-lyase/cystathionine gamma-synthase
VRMRQHEKNALALAQWLEAQTDDVAQVFYPGLESHPDHELAKRQQRGFGGVVSFRVRGGAERACELARTTRLFNLAVSLGGVESLICVPAQMTHKTVPAERKAELGITDDLLRLSVGLEDVEDLIADLGEALALTAPLAEAVAVA